MQEAEEQQVDPALAVLHHAPRDLLGRADEAGPEAVVVLHQVAERRVGPHALAVAGGCPGLLHGLAEALDGVGVRLRDDLLEHVQRLLLGVARDDEAVEAEPDPLAAAGGAGGGEDVGALLLEAREVLAVGEVPVGDPAAHLARVRAIAAHEDLRVRAAGHVDGRRLQREVVDPVEVTEVRELLLRPEAAEHSDELLGTPVALPVLEPRLAEADELVLQPAGDDVDGGAAVGHVIGRDDPLGEHARVPEARVHGGDHLEPLGREQEAERERGRLVLLVGAVGRGVPHLAEGVVEAVALGELRDADVEVEVEVGALLDVARHEAARDVRDPVGEGQRVGGCGGGVLGHADMVGACAGADPECCAV